MDAMGAGMALAVPILDCRAEAALVREALVRTLAAQHTRFDLRRCSANYRGGFYGVQPVIVETAKAMLRGVTNLQAIRQQAQAPALVPGRRRTAHQRDKMGFLDAIERAGFVGPCQR